MTRFKSSAFVQYLAVAVAVIGSAQIAGAADTSVGGFLDAGFPISGAAGDPSIIRDGAIYFGHTSGNTTFKFDMPFQMAGGAVANNDMLIGFDKAQAFFSHTYSNGAGWRMGQFDGIFGLERNDTVDNFFVNQGTLFTYTQPRTNTGIEGSYKITDSIKAQAYVSGVNNNGGSKIGSRPEFGGKVSLSGDFNVGLGGWFRAVNDDTSAMYLNLTADTKLAGFNLGVEGAYQKAGEADAKMSFGVMGNTNVMDKLDAGVRAQYLMDQIAAGSTQMEATAGVRYMMDKNLSVKANYVFGSTTAAEGADSVTDHSGQVAAVYGF